MDARLRELFDRASDLQPSERPQFLDQACGDNAQLRAELESLLSALEDAGPFMSEPTAAWNPPPAAAVLTSAEQAGAIIGRYKLLEKIGEGGFGVVYMAQQSEPIRRRVALKIIKLGMDTQQVVARFEAERQALALMDHPNIARVIDGGATETGRPYFVMELVRGDPITRYCDRERLTTRQRLQLFQQVCFAIQHAHQKGIIHRDIKPSNVLVTISDDKPLVKVIDFGIAKATNTELTSKTLFTEFRALIGTPAYMSPEQAERSGVDIDTRSDIYSLGVLLYEMLTGRTPIDPQVLGSAVWAELQRIICEQEPQRPSTMVSTTQGDITDIAQRRSTEPARLGGILRGDLDWIVLKSLDKDRTRRYETAGQFAEDVGRYLRDEPVEAMPPSRRYQLSKFAKRNRVLITSIGAVILALIAGLVGTSIATIAAHQQRQFAIQAEHEAQEHARRARLAATLAGTSLLPEAETKQLVAAWKEDIDRQSKMLPPDSRDLVAQQCQYATWYGRWLLARGQARESQELIKDLYLPAKNVLGFADPGFSSLCDIWIQTEHRLDAAPTVLVPLYEDLIKSITQVHGEEKTLPLLPEFAVLLAQSSRDQQAITTINLYLAKRTAIDRSLSVEEIVKLDAAIDALTHWGSSHEEVFGQLKAYRDSGIAAPGDNGLDPELAQDMETLQGRWEWKEYRQGKQIEHMVCEFSGNQCSSIFFDDQGNIVHGRDGKVKLSRSGACKVLTSYLGAPTQGVSFVYQIKNGQLTLVSGMLTNYGSLPETKLRRLKRAPTTK